MGNGPPATPDGIKTGWGRICVSLPVDLVLIDDLSEATLKVIRSQQLQFAHTVCAAAADAYKVILAAVDGP